MCLFTELTLGMFSGSALDCSAAAPETMLADPFFLFPFQLELLLLFLSALSVVAEVFLSSLSLGHEGGLWPFLVHRSQVLFRHGQEFFLCPLRAQVEQFWFCLPLLLWTELAVPDEPFSTVFVAAS